MCSTRTRPKYDVVCFSLCPFAFLKSKVLNFQRFTTFTSVLLSLFVGGSTLGNHNLLILLKLEYSAKWLGSYVNSTLWRKITNISSISCCSWHLWMRMAYGRNRNLHSLQVLLQREDLGQARRFCWTGPRQRHPRGDAHLLQQDHGCELQREIRLRPDQPAQGRLQGSP